MTLNPVIFLQASVFSSVKWESYYIFKRDAARIAKRLPLWLRGERNHLQCRRPGFDL